MLLWNSFAAFYVYDYWLYVNLNNTDFSERSELCAVNRRTDKSDYK